MAVRQKLAFERLALLLLDMRLRYGDVVRYREVALQREGRCIDCAQRIDPGAAYQARWRDRPTTGFYAHVKCPSLESAWLTDDGFYQVFDYSVESYQACADCRNNRAQVRVVVPAPERMQQGGVVLRYVCSSCVGAPPRSRG